MYSIEKLPIVDVMDMERGNMYVAQRKLDGSLIGEESFFLFFKPTTEPRRKQYTENKVFSFVLGYALRTTLLPHGDFKFATAFETKFSHMVWKGEIGGYEWRQITHPEYLAEEILRGFRIGEYKIDPIQHVSVECYSSISGLFEETVYDFDGIPEKRFVRGKPQWMLVVQTYNGKLFTQCTGLTGNSGKKEAQRMADDIILQNEDQDDWNRENWKFWRNIYGSPAWDRTQDSYYGGE